MNLTPSTLLLLFSLIILFTASIGLLIHLAFKIRIIINQALSNKGSRARISWYFTLIYNLFYIQYEINRISEDKENKPRTAPWVLLEMIITLIIIGIVTIIFFG
jgi:hypothetical protein